MTDRAGRRRRPQRLAAAVAAGRATWPGPAAARWEPGRTLLTEDAFYLIATDLAGNRLILATEAALLGREVRATRH